MRDTQQGSNGRWKQFIAGALVLLTTVVVQAKTALADQPPQFVTKWGSNGTGNGEGEFFSLAVDGSGYVYVTDFLSNRVQKFTESGTFVLAWGSYGTDNGQFEQGPNGIAIDQTGIIYVSTNANVHRFDAIGTFLGRFPASLGGIDVDPSGQYLYGATSRTVRQYTTAGVFIREWATTDDSRAANTGIAVGPSGAVYVAEGGAAHNIQKYSSDGTLLTSWGDFGSADGEFRFPSGLAVDADEKVYVCDANNARIQEFTSTGTFLTKWGMAGSGDGEFLGAIDIALDNVDNIYVLDSTLDRIQKFRKIPTPTRSTTWGRIKALYREHAKSLQ